MFIFLISDSVQAELIQLKDGTEITGNIGAWNADGSEFYIAPKNQGVDAKPRWIAISDVKSIRYDAVYRQDQTPPQTQTP